MNENDHRALRDMLGAYALDQVDATDAQNVRRHLQSCPSCKSELRDIAGLAELLDDADPHRAMSPPEPPSELEERIVARLGEREPRPARQPKPRNVLVGAAAALVAVVTVITVVLVLPSDKPPREQVSLVSVPAAVSAEAALISHTWGTELIFSATGLPEGQVYEVTFRDATGNTIAAGSFIGTGDAPMTCNLTVGVLRRNVAGFVVSTNAGDSVLYADLE